MTKTPPLQIRTFGGIERCQPQAGLEGPKPRLGGTEGGSGARTGHAPYLDLEPGTRGHSFDQPDVGHRAGVSDRLEAESCGVPSHGGTSGAPGAVSLGLPTLRVGSPITNASSTTPIYDVTDGER